VGKSRKSNRAVLQWVGLILGPLLALVTYLLLPDSYQDSGAEPIPFSPAGRATAATGVWMAIWWMTEAIPISATALLPIALFPLFGALPVSEAAAPYAHKLIFMFMGGFIIALAMQRWGLHRRIALQALHLVGTRPASIVAGFMGVTAFLSMWVSNTATTIMMLPVATSVIEVAQQHAELPDDVRHTQEEDSFALCLLLGIAYAASIGGIGTLIGTPPNLFLASFAESQLGIEITFLRWMGVGHPLVALFLPITWILLTRWIYPLPSAPIAGGAALLRGAYESLTPMNRGERITLCVFLLTAGAWISRPLLATLEIAGTRPLAGLSDAGIAMLSALLLFVIPVDTKERIFTMDWETAVALPWGLLLLFGGGLSLAAAIQANGVGEFIGSQVAGMEYFPAYLLILVVPALIMLLTELTSNTATTATFLPILASLAIGFGLSPIFLIVPAAIAASCAFMLPVATPPNAIVFGSGKISIPQMCKAGIWLNVIGVVLITSLTYAVVLPLLGNLAAR